MWLKRVLVPFWLVELIALKIMLIVCILAFVALSVDSDYADNNDIPDYNHIIHEAEIILGVLLAFSIVSIIMDWVEIVMFARQKLRPVAYLSMSCIKFAFWAVIFVLDIVGVAKAGSSSSRSIIWPIIIVITTLGQVIYGAVMVHRQRKGTLDRGLYTPAITQSTAYETRRDLGPKGDSYEPYNPHGSASPYREPSPVPPPPMKMDHPAYGVPPVEHYGQRPHSYEMQTPGVVR